MQSKACSKIIWLGRPKFVQRSFGYAVHSFRIQFVIGVQNLLTIMCQWNKKFFEDQKPAKLIFSHYYKPIKITDIVLPKKSYVQL